jgi:hypothetical protein
VICARCGVEPFAHVTSFFNTDVICLPCATDEQEAPGYVAAHAAEVAAVRAGDYNFPGVGLSPADAAFLAARRRRVS